VKTLLRVTNKKRKRGGVPGPRTSIHEKRGCDNLPKNRTGNPFGRPTGKNSIAEILRELGNVILPEYTSQSGVYKNISRKHALHIAAYDEALYNRQPWAVEYIAERTEGKVVQPVGLPAEVIHITYTDDPAPKEKGE